MRQLKSVAALLLTALATAWAAPAAASEWMLVWFEGDMPNRSNIYADYGMLGNRLDDDPAAAPLAMLKRLRVLQVFEGKDYPDRIDMNVEYRCAQQQVRIVGAEAFNRNTTVTSIPDTEWKAIPMNWLRRGYTMACEEQKIAKARREDAKKGNGEKLVELGLISMGEQFGSSLSDFTWTTFWQDGTRPPFTTTKTREEIDRDYAEIKKKIAAQDAQMGQAANDAQKRIDGIKQEEAFIASIRKNFQTKDKKFHTLFYSTPGWDEAQINSAWGAPIRSLWEGSTRVLVYAYQDTVYDQVQTPVDIMGCQGGVCGKVGETSQTNSVARTANCERYLYLRPGGNKAGPRLVDYAYSCF
jgi:hypothetical protein